MATATAFNSERLSTAARQLVTRQSKGTLTEVVLGARALMLRQAITDALSHDAPAVIDRFYYHAAHWDGTLDGLVDACRRGPFRGKVGKRI